MSAPLVLVVDDEPGLRDAICEAFLDDGWQVAAAANGDDACHYLARAKATPDLIVLDLDMPIMDGVTFHGWLRGQKAPLSATPVLIVSASSRVRQIAASLGGEAWLMKPTLPDPLLTTARRLITRKSG